MKGLGRASRQLNLSVVLGIIPVRKMGLLTEGSIPVDDSKQKRRGTVNNHGLQAHFFRCHIFTMDMK